MRTLRVGALTMLLSVLSLPALVSADDGAAALLPFQGPQASKLRQSVQSGLQAADVSLVSLKQVNAVVRQTKGYSKQAAKLKASVLVRTRVRRVEGRWIADTEVRNAKGQRVEKLRTNSSSAVRLSNRIVAQLMKTGQMPGVEAPAAAVASPEPAAPTQPRLVVRPFTGAQAAKIRGAAVQGLRPEPIEMFPNNQFSAKAEALGVDLASDGGHIAPASALGVSGLIEGDVLQEDGAWSAYVRLVDGNSATVVSQHFYEGSTSAALQKAVRAKIGSDFRKDINKLGVASVAAVAVVPVTAVAAAPVARESKQAKAAVQYEARPSSEQRPAAAGRAVERRVVEENDTAVFRQPRVDLDLIRAGGESRGEPGRRVFRRARRGAAVPDDQESPPVEDQAALPGSAHVREAKPFDRLTPEHMAAKDLVDVVHRDRAVPDRLGVDDDRNPVGALVEAARGVDPNAPFDARVLGENSQAGADFPGVLGGATPALASGVPQVLADEDVAFEGRHEGKSNRPAC